MCVKWDRSILASLYLGELRPLGLLNPAIDGSYAMNGLAIHRLGSQPISLQAESKGSAARLHQNVFLEPSREKRSGASCRCHIPNQAPIRQTRWAQDLQGGQCLPRLNRFCASPDPDCSLSLLRLVPILLERPAVGTALFSFPPTSVTCSPRRSFSSFCAYEASFPSASFSLNAANIEHNGKTKWRLVRFCLSKSRVRQI